MSADSGFSTKGPQLTADPVPWFACDAMLGGLARWLRAAGYDASWQAGIDDHDLIRFARQDGRTLLSSDTRIFLFAVVRDGDLPALFVPLRLTPHQQLSHVLSALKLPLREPRCMGCGGALAVVPKEAVQDQVPPRTLAWLNEYWRCERCGRVLWRGSHWQRIAERLGQIATRGQ